MKRIMLAASAPAVALAAMLFLAEGIEAQEVKAAQNAKKTENVPEAKKAPDAPKAQSERKGVPQVQFDPEQGKAGLRDSVKPPRVGESYDRSVRHNIPVLQAAKRSENRYVDREELYKRDDPSLEGKAELIIGKQRNGPIATVRLNFIRKFTRFAHPEYRDEEEAPI